MGAAVVTTSIIEETAYKVVVVCTGTFSDTQETTALKVDADALGGGGLYPGKTPTLHISRAQWNCTGVGVVKVLFDAGTDDLALQLGGQGDQYYEAPIINPQSSGYNGDILFTTTGFASGGSYQIILTLDKNLGSYTQAPYVTALAIKDAKSGVYKTGDTLIVQATFNQVINPDSGSAYIELVLAGSATTVRAVLDRSNPTIDAHATGGGTVYAVFKHTFTSADEAAATEVTLGNITGINGTGIGQSNVINVLPALSGISAFVVNVAAATVGALVAGNGHHFVSGDPLSLTVTFDEAVVVTGVPQVPVVINLTTRQASYLSGSGTNVLTFRYTPVVSGDVATAGQFSVSSPIGLNGGTIKAHTVAATLAFTPPTTDTVTVN